MNLGYHIEAYHMLPYHSCAIFLIFINGFPSQDSHALGWSLLMHFAVFKAWWMHIPQGLLALDLGRTAAGRATTEPVGYFSQIKWSSCKVFSPLPESLLIRSFFPIPSDRPPKWHSGTGWIWHKDKENVRGSLSLCQTVYPGCIIGEWILLPCEEWWRDGCFG